MIHYFDKGFGTIFGLQARMGIGYSITEDEHRRRRLSRDPEDNPLEPSSLPYIV